MELHKQAAILPALMICLLAPAALSLEPQEPDAQTRLLRWMDRIAQEQLDRRAAEIETARTPEAAEQRKTVRAREDLRTDRRCRITPGRSTPR